MAGIIAQVAQLERGHGWGAQPARAHEGVERAAGAQRGWHGRSERARKHGRAAWLAQARKAQWRGAAQPGRWPSGAVWRRPVGA
jgi:hypothetical protein